MAQLVAMLLAHKSYWLIPVITVFLCLILLTIIASFSGGATTPFIYTLF